MTVILPAPDFFRWSPALSGWLRPAQSEKKDDNL